MSNIGRRGIIMASSAHTILDAVASSSLNGGGWVTGIHGLTDTSYAGMYNADGSAIGTAIADTTGPIVEIPTASIAGTPLIGMICSSGGSMVYIENLTIVGPDYRMVFLNLDDDDLYSGSASETVIFGGALLDHTSTTLRVPDANIDGRSRVIWTNLPEDFANTFILANFVNGFFDTDSFGEVKWSGFEINPGDSPAINIAKWQILEIDDFPNEFIDWDNSLNITIDGIDAERPPFSTSPKHLHSVNGSLGCSLINSQCIGGATAVFSFGNYEDYYLYNVDISNCITGILSFSIATLINKVTIINCTTGIAVFRITAIASTITECDSGIIMTTGDATFTAKMVNCIVYGNDVDFIGNATPVGGHLSLIDSDYGTLSSGIIPTRSISRDPLFASTTPGDSDFLEPTDPIVLALQAGAVQPPNQVADESELVQGVSITNYWWGEPTVIGTYTPFGPSQPGESIDLNQILGAIRSTLISAGVFAFDEIARENEPFENIDQTYYIESMVPGIDILDIDDGRTVMPCMIQYTIATPDGLGTFTAYEKSRAIEQALTFNIDRYIDAGKSLVYISSVDRLRAINDQTVHQLGVRINMTVRSL